MCTGRRFASATRSAFEDEGEPLADADAEGGDGGAGAVAGELVGDGACEAGAGGAEGVAEGDGAAVGVEDGGVEVGPFGDAAEDLGGEGLVQFEDGQVVECPARLGEC